jgi:hypothetical protein
MRRESKKELSDVIAYFKRAILINYPQGDTLYAGRDLEISFRYFLRYLQPKKIREGIERVSFKKVDDPFRYLCGILHSWSRGED